MVDFKVRSIDIFDELGCRELSFVPGMSFERTLGQVGNHEVMIGVMRECECEVIEDFYHFFDVLNKDIDAAFYSADKRQLVLLTGWSEEKVTKSLEEMRKRKKLKYTNI